MMQYLDSSKAKIFLSDYADVCYTRFYRVFRRLDMLLVSRFKNLCPGLTMELAQIRAEDGTFQVYCQYVAESTEVETNLSVNLSKNFEGILRPDL